MGAARYIYICSAGHSGSTLLDLLIGSHSRVAPLGEIDQLSKNLALNTQCSCGKPVRSCDLWQAVAERVGKDIGIDVFARPYDLHMGYPKASTVIDPAHQTPAYLVRRRLILGALYLQLRSRISLLTPLTHRVTVATDNNFRVFDAVRDILSVDAIVDSSKSYLKAVSLYLRRPEHVRILLLTRDGRGVLWSNLKRGTSRAAAIGEWQHQYTRALPLLDRHVARDHVLRVRYEDLTSTPRETLQSICNFAELTFEESMLDFRAKAHHVANGNRMRISGSSSIRRDDEWLAGLSPDDLAFFERTAGRLNRSLGYT